MQNEKYDVYKHMPNLQKGSKETLYIGKTYRSIKERHGEHIRDWLEDKEESHMARHSRECHNGVTDFMMKPLTSHRTAMGRQIAETVRIKVKSLEGAHLLNSKTEYNRCLLPELTVELGKNKPSEETESTIGSQESVFRRGRKLEQEDKN